MTAATSLHGDDQRDHSEEAVSPSEWLVMEVLVARLRLGEPHWPFPKSHMRTIRKLEKRNWVGWKGHIVAGALMVWLTGDGERAWGVSDGGSLHDQPWQRSAGEPIEMVDAPTTCPNRARACASPPNCPTTLVAYAFCPRALTVARHALIEEIMKEGS